MKKILALIMALAMVLSLAACGGNGGDDETTTAPAGETSANGEVDDTDAAIVDGTEAASDEDATATSDEASTEEASTDAEGNTEATATQAGAQTGSKDLSKAEFVALLNSATAKIVKSGSYSFNRNCSYTRKIDVGNATDALNDLISGIDENSNLDTVVGGFLGIGNRTADYPKHSNNDSLKNYFLKATTLKESDLASFSGSNGVYTFTLPAAKNPKKTGATPLSRFTNDFITHEEVEKGIKDFTSAITLKSTTVNYTNIKVDVTVKDGKITNIKYSYNFDAALTLSLLFTINGDGAAKTTNTYSNIKY